MNQYDNITKARESINILRGMLDIYQWDSIREKIEFAIQEVSKCIPAKPIRENWNPNRCPCCGADLGGECYDGYWQNPYFEICPDCRQVLDYGNGLESE